MSLFRNVPPEDGMAVPLLAFLALALAGLFCVRVLGAATLVDGKTAVWWLDAADYQAAHGNTTTARVFYERALSATAGAKDGTSDAWMHRRAAKGLTPRTTPTPRPTATRTPTEALP